MPIQTIVPFGGERETRLCVTLRVLATFLPARCFLHTGVPRVMEQVGRPRAKEHRSVDVFRLTTNNKSTFNCVQLQINFTTLGNSTAAQWAALPSHINPIHTGRVSSAELWRRSSGEDEFDTALRWCHLVSGNLCKISQWKPELFMQWSDLLFVCSPLINRFVWRDFLFKKKTQQKLYFNDDNHLI